MQADLDTAIQAIHVRFGEHSLQRAVRLPVSEPWPSGVAVVDRLSGIGGLPRGRISVLSGSATSGKLSLGLALLARATQALAQVIVIDPGRGFDPSALAPLHADLRPLTLVRPHDAATTGEATTALARAGAGFVLLLGSPGEADLAPLEAASARSGTLVLAVVEVVSQPLAYASSLTLGLERGGWLYERGELIGVRSLVRCLKNKLAAPVGQAQVEIRYPLGAGLFFDTPVREAAAAPATDVEMETWAARSAAV